MPNLTPAEAKALGRRAAQPTRAPGELLAIFVSGKLANPLNGTPWVWQKRTRYARAWKDRVAMALFEYGYVPAEGPKRIHLAASLWNWMDCDGLQAACKPIRDALVDCRVVSGDAERDGHAWTYSQQINRARRGVEIRVSVKTTP